MRSQKANFSTQRQYSCIVLQWRYCLGHAGMKGNDWTDMLAGKATLTSGLLLRRSEVLRSLRHYLQAQSQGHHTTDRLEERDVERGNARNLPWKDERGPSSIRRTLEPFQRQQCRNFREMGEAHNYRLFWSHRYRVELNWMNWSYIKQLNTKLLWTGFILMYSI